MLYDDECFDYENYDESQLWQILLYELSAGNSNRRRPLHRIIKESHSPQNSLYKSSPPSSLAFPLVNLKRKIKKRDGSICVECGVSESLEVHHILPMIDFPEKALDGENCILLCHECHMEKHHGE